MANQDMPVGLGAYISLHSKLDQIYQNCHMVLCAVIMYL